MSTPNPTGNVTDIDISDEQIDKYIESRGEVELETPKQEEVVEEAQPVETAEEPQEVEVKEDKKKPPEGYVKHEALHEERMRRKELQQKIQLMEQRFQEVMGKIQPKEDQPKPPAFEEDPAAHLRYQQEQLHRSVQEQQQFIAQQRALAEQQARQQALINSYAAKAAEYEKENPNFRDAYQFLLESRKNEYLAVGYSLDQVVQMLQQDEIAIVNKAFEDEVNPAERIYNIAKARGYQGKKPAPTSQQKIEAIDKGVKASKTLSSVSGATPKGLTLEAIAEMSDEEFNKIDYEEIRRLGMAE